MRSDSVFDAWQTRFAFISMVLRRMVLAWTMKG